MKKSLQTQCFLFIYLFHDTFQSRVLAAMQMLRQHSRTSYALSHQLFQKITITYEKPTSTSKRMQYGSVQEHAILLHQIVLIIYQMEGYCYIKLYGKKELKRFARDTLTMLKNATKKTTLLCLKDTVTMHLLKVSLTCVVQKGNQVDKYCLQKIQYLI